ncbi:tetratricopeptide repeat protein [Shewanella sp. 30m-9]
MRWIFTVAILYLLSACSSVPPQHSQKLPELPQTNHQLFNVSGHSVPTYEDLVSLTKIQVDDIHQFVSQKAIAMLPRHKQVSEYLSKRLVNFNYQGANYSARNAMDKVGGNCMSLALLSYAVAKELGVETVFQVMHTEPLLLDITADFAVTSNHVRTFLYEKSGSEKENKGFYFSTRNYLILDYFPGRYDRVGKIANNSQFIAMLYRNLAADALLDSDLDLAYSLLSEGIKYDDKYAPLINMMAIVHRRKGDVVTSDALYRYGLAVSDSKISLLSNYHYLLSKQGNTEQARNVKQQLLSLQDSSPYDWYLIGQDALANDDFKSAEIYLRKFLKNTPYYHKAYFDLAKAQYALGQNVSAKNSIKLALEYAELPQNQQQYLAKLNWLKQK